MAQELIKLDKLLWRKTEDGSLFPCPLQNLKTQSLKKQNILEAQTQNEKIQALFRMMGALIGRAILDERLIDLPIHHLFWDLVLDRVTNYSIIHYIYNWKKNFKKPVYLGDMKKIDKKLGETLLGLQEIVMKKKEIEKNELIPLNLKSQQIERLTFKVIFYCFDC